MNTNAFPNHSTVYGPVKSWRFGESLGIDPLFQTSICSFNCIYCQLGEIQVVTQERKVYVPTSQVLDDLKTLLKTNVKIDVITFSGLGEPTLALNLGEMASEIKKVVPHIPLYILTNATELYREEVKQELKLFDKVMLKLDASNETDFNKINRPASGIDFSKHIKNIKEFISNTNVDCEIQSMFMPLNFKELENFAKLIKDLSPNAVALNTPKRPYPLSFHKENRGNHLGIFNYEVRELKRIGKEEASTLEEIIEKLSGVKVYSVYQDR